MNCQQFEDRVQQLLDERTSLSLDLQLQQHAKSCMDCASALNLYGCFEHAPTSSGIRPTVASSIREPVKLESSTVAWKKDQHRHLRHRVFLAAAAMLFISFALLSRTGVQQPTVAKSAELNPADLQVTDLQLNSEFDSTVAVAPDSFFLSSFFADTWSSSTSWTGVITDASYVDLSSIGRIDLTYLIPLESARVVQSIPSTIQTIEPFYRYSTDLPVMKQWSSGINYTIGLIHSSLSQEPSPQPLPANGSDDFGSRVSTNLDLC